MSLDGINFAELPATVFAKPVRTKVGYYCKSLTEKFNVKLKPYMLYAFRCINDVQAKVECGLCSK